MSEMSHMRWIICGYFCYRRITHFFWTRYHHKTTTDMFTHVAWKSKAIHISYRILVMTWNKFPQTIIWGNTKTILPCKWMGLMNKKNDNLIAQYVNKYASLINFAPQFKVLVWYYKYFQLYMVQYLSGWLYLEYSKAQLLASTLKKLILQSNSYILYLLVVAIIKWWNSIHWAEIRVKQDKMHIISTWL